MKKNVLGIFTLIALIVVGMMFNACATFNPDDLSFSLSRNVQNGEAVLNGDVVGQFLYFGNYFGNHGVKFFLVHRRVIDDNSFFRIVDNQLIASSDLEANRSYYIRVKMVSQENVNSPGVEKDFNFPIGSKPRYSIADTPQKFPQDFQGRWYREGSGHGDPGSVIVITEDNYRVEGFIISNYKLLAINGDLYTMQERERIQEKPIEQNIKLVDGNLVIDDGRAYTRVGGY